MVQQDYQASIDKGSADPTQAGFDFQFYTFVYLVLKIGADGLGEYETDDDLVYKKGWRRIFNPSKVLQS